MRRAGSGLDEKMRVLGLEGKIWVKFKSNKQLYMQCVIDLL